MSKTNTILEINIKGNGYKLIWTNKEPKIDDIIVIENLPKAKEEKIGANVAFNCNKLKQNLFFLATVSNFDFQDEFGRRGVKFFQGILIETDDSLNNLDLIYTNFIKMLEFHRLKYNYLRNLLERIATQTIEDDTGELIESLITFEEFPPERNDTVRKPLINKLKELTTSSEERLCLRSYFPWADYLNIYGLIGIQLESKEIFAIGGGFHTSFEKFRHLATNQNISGFKVLNVNDMLEVEKKDEGINNSSFISDSTKKTDFSFLKIIHLAGNICFIVSAFILVGLSLLLLTSDKYSFWETSIAKSKVIYFVLAIWAIIPPIWFYGESYLVKEGRFHRRASLNRKQNFFIMIWISTFMLITIFLLSLKQF